MRSGKSSAFTGPTRPWCSPLTLDDRNPKRDVFALALLAGCIFLALALGTYHPHDPPAATSWPAPTEVKNACGKIGALVADYLFRGLGYGAYFVLVSLVVIDMFLLARRSIAEPGMRAFGWALALAGFTTVTALAAPHWDGPLIGPGGYLGASGRAWLETHFASVGSYVLALSTILAGTLLCTDYILVRVATLFFGTPARGLAAVGKRALRKRPQMAATDVETIPATALIKTPELKKALAAKEQAEQDDEDDAPVSIRFRGKRQPEASDEDDEDEDSDDESEDDAEDEEESSDDESDDSPVSIAMPVKAAAVSNPRIKNNGQKDDRTNVMQELDAASRKEDVVEYELPPIDLLIENEIVYGEEHEKEVRVKAKQIEKTFLDFGFNVKVVEIETGPVIAQYEIELEAGLKLSKITGLSDDLAIALRVPSVRIVAPIPGKNTVGIEVPNNTRQLVRLREVIEETEGKIKKMKIPIFLGKDVAGNAMVVDLTTMPHLLIAGRTGTGKSVCLNTIIASMLMTRKPDEVKMLMIDPKMVELSCYKTLPHLMHPVVTDMRKAEAILAWAVEKMEERYALLARAGVRHMSVYNGLSEDEMRDRLKPETDEEWASIPRTLPYIVIIADEIADLMMTSGKEVEQHIIRLAQKSRAVGIHLILATQKPTVDVITGLIKSNLPARIAFQVASRTDSRVVLDEMGADKLLGNGDMLFLWPGTSTLLRGQGTYLTDEEINKVVDFVSTTEPEFVKELVQLKTKDAPDGDARERIKSRDDLYESAVETVLREGRGSVSLLQRALGVGYGRAARMIDYMAEDGIVGEYNGSNAREILMTLEQWNDLMGGGNAEPGPPAATAPPTKRNRIVPERDNSANPGEKPVSKSKRNSDRNPNEHPPAPHVPLSLPAPATTGPTARLPHGAVQGSSALALGMMTETKSAPWEADPEQAPHLYDEDQEQEDESAEDSELEDEATVAMNAESSDADGWPKDPDDDQDEEDDEDSDEDAEEDEDEDEDEDEYNDEDEEDEEDDDE
jgi:S-DNA-T family DNA segregation ATPase FtsK/SpoIIIE